MTASFKLKNQSHIGTPPWRAPKPRQLKEIGLKAVGAVGSYRNRSLTARAASPIRLSRKSLVFNVYRVPVELAP